MTWQLLVPCSQEVQLGSKICFLMQCSCALQVQPSYLMLDAFHHGHVEGHMSVTSIMAESEHLRESQDLFELYVSDYIMLTRCKVS